MVQTETDGQTPTGDGLIEHPTQGDSVDGGRLDPKANNSPCKLIHHDQDPMGFEQHRFHPKQVQAPKTVFGMAQQREPRRTPHAAFGPIMGCQNPPNDVLVNLDAEGFSQLLGNPGAAKPRIALLEFNDSSDQFRGWSLGTRLALAGSEIEPPVLACLEGRMKSEQGRGFENHRATQNRVAPVRLRSGENRAPAGFRRFDVAGRATPASQPQPAAAMAC